MEGPVPGVAQGWEAVTGWDRSILDLEGSFWELPGSKV